MKKRTGLGVILIVLGVVWLLESMFFVQIDLTLIIIAAFLGMLYYLSGETPADRTIGLLIASSIVLMVGIHNIVDSLYYLGDLNGVLFFFLLGSAFWLVYFLHTSQLKGKKGGSWPVYVGWALYAFSAFIFLVEYVHISRGVFQYIWPVGLIIIGLIIVLKNRGTY